MITPWRLLSFMVDLRNLERGDSVQVTLDSGEEFSGKIVSKEQEPANEFSKGWIRLSFEGEWWEQVNNRVDDEVLTLRQDFGISSGRAKGATMEGVKWVGKDPESSEPKYIILGHIELVNKK